MLDEAGRLSQIRAFEDTLLMAMDGVEYFSSHTIACPHCSTQTAKDGAVRYFHAAVTPVIALPRTLDGVALSAGVHCAARWTRQAGL